MEQQKIVPRSRAIFLVCAVAQRHEALGMPLAICEERISQDGEGNMKGQELQNVEMVQSRGFVITCFFLTVSMIRNHDCKLLSGQSLVANYGSNETIDISPKHI